MNILVTGGIGYIGSHTVVELLNANHNVTVIDNLHNSNISAVNNIERITGKHFIFHQADICDQATLCKIFVEAEACAQQFDCVIHFAGFKSVYESVNSPLKYYQNNIAGTISLLEIMRKHCVKSIVFSSSAAVYGNCAFLPVAETCPKGEITSPYGRTKSMIEQILMDLVCSDPEWHIAILRYFNPVGAHESGLIGENPNSEPSNLMPYITQVASGNLPYLRIWGDDYNTPDGTGVRDYIHVVDLAIGHVMALKSLEHQVGVEIYNLGTGRGYSVLNVVKAFEETVGVAIPYVIHKRRQGDVDACYADPTKAYEKLGWKTKRGIKEMCIDAWRRQNTLDLFSN